MRYYLIVFGNKWKIKNDMSFVINLTVRIVNEGTKTTLGINTSSNFNFLRVPRAIQMSTGGLARGKTREDFNFINRSFICDLVASVFKDNVVLFFITYYYTMRERKTVRRQWVPICRTSSMFSSCTIADVDFGSNCTTCWLANASELFKTLSSAHFTAGHIQHVCMCNIKTWYLYTI